MGNGNTEQTESDAAEHSEPQGVLAGYEARKHALAQILREVNAAATRVKQETLERAVLELTKKLADARFYLTAIGHCPGYVGGDRGELRDQGTSHPAHRGEQSDERNRDP